MSTKYNLKHILKIEIKDKELSEKYVYKERHFFKEWFKTVVREEGIYNISPVSWDDYNKYFTLDEFENDKQFFKYIVINKQVFIKPIVTLTFVNNEGLNFYFPTLEEANNKVKEITDLNDPEWLSCG